MGIGNTTSAALLMAALTGAPLAASIGRGTGATDAQLEAKRAAAARALALHPVRGALEALQAFGGFEIVMMTGAMLRAASHAMAIIVDGFIAGAAVLAAHAMEPAVLAYCIFAHESHEQGHRRLLDYLGARPLLQLEMRLGEGTGAALAVPLVRSAAAFLKEMASFAEAGVSEAGGAEPAGPQGSPGEKEARL
jgi:nicotinate-nucleotide--dimethylbenzimidazole phosphoribosyltransferase